MRLAKEMVVNLTVNEYVRIRVSKTRRGFIGLVRKKMRFLVKLILIYKSSQRARRAFFKK